jgi:predicted anti-sigma-YlaC factor YlaD
MVTWFRRLFTRASMKKKRSDATTSSSLSCQEVVELVTDYLEGALLQEKRAHLEEHLAGCEGCTNYIEQVRLTISMLRDLTREPVFPETKEELLQVFRQWKSSQ